MKSIKTADGWYIDRSQIDYWYVDQSQIDYSYIDQSQIDSFCIGESEAQAWLEKFVADLNGENNEP